MGSLTIATTGYCTLLVAMGAATGEVLVDMVLAAHHVLALW